MGRRATVAGGRLAGLILLLAATSCHDVHLERPPVADVTADASEDALPADAVPTEDGEPTDGVAPPDGMRVVTKSDAGLPDLVRYVMALPDGRVLRAMCPPTSDDGLVCDGTDVILTAQVDAVDVVIKARGHRFIAFGVSGDGLTGSDPKVIVGLDPLPAPEVTADYQTGIDDLATFEALAVPATTELGPVELVKFLITDVQGSPTLYLQNTKKQQLHYAFAHQVLGLPMSLAEFEAATYHGADRELMAGTLVRYPGRTVQTASGPLTSPIAVTFFPSDDLTPAQALVAHQLIEERLGFAALDGPDGRVAYLPAGSQQQAELDADLQQFASRDAIWFSQGELWGSVDLQLLNPGVAFGTLRVMSPEELDAAVVSFTDVLVLSRLPNHLPIVGGTITEELQTPLAHVNVAARARGTPNMALLGASTDPRVAPLVGKLVRFEVTPAGFDLREATLDEATAFWTEQQDKPPLVPVADLERDGLLPFEDIGFADAIAVGVKAANVAELSHLLGAKAPHGFAVPFHHYDRFMSESLVNALLCKGARADCLAEGRSEEVCAAAYAFCAASPGESLFDLVDRLLDDPSIQADTPLREAALDNLRWLVGHIPVAPDFAAALDAKVAEVHGAAKVRLRSSTNAEDLPEFSGAGLYTSTGAHASGKDRASEEIRTVWASVWNFAAFEERSFWNIDHRAVRMGVAVHEAFEDEEANGVLVTQNIADPNVVGMYVNAQAGEVSVTNPVGGALPEVFTIVPAPQGLQVVRQRFSSLSPDAPIMSIEEIGGLATTAYKVQLHFAPLYGKSPSVLALDMEFKLLADTRALVVKQVRPYFQAH